MFNVLACVVSVGGLDIVLTAHSGRSALLYLSDVLIHSPLLPLQAFDPRRKYYIEEGKYKDWIKSTGNTADT